MFSSKVRRKSIHLANDHGYNDAWLGVPNSNPYRIGTQEYLHYNKGYQEAQETIDEWEESPFTTGLWGRESENFY